MEAVVRFIATEVERIALTCGDWIEVKKDLNTGEQKELESAGSGTPVRLQDSSVYTPIDWSRYEIERCAIYLLDWSFKGPDDKVVPLKDKDGKVMVASIKALDPLDFIEVNDAITNHILTRSIKKKAERESRRSKNVAAVAVEAT